MNKILINALITALITTTLMAEDISSYLYANYSNSDSVRSSLNSNGFEIVGEYDSMGNADYHVIAYTNEALKSKASLENRGFAAVLKVLISKKDNQLIFTNPEYFLQAFLQDDFDKDGAIKIKNTLTSAFGQLEGSKDALEDDDIAGFHFMAMMPYYEDMIEVADGENLLSKLEKNAGSNIVFKVALENSTLVGVAMPTDKGEKTYVTAIKGEKHSAFLPYMILIEGDEAKIMHAKYYLAVSYPKLTMGEFMDISDAPGDIEDYMSGLFE